MNLVSSYPHVSLNLANPPTESVARDNRMREMVQRPAQSQPQPEKRPVASEQEKGLPINHSAQQPVGYDLAEQRREPLPETRQDGSQQHSDQQGGGEDDQQRQQQEQQARGEEQQLALEQEQLRELKARDREVRTHEQAHASVGGQYAGNPTYSFERGPDGSNYAVAGEVKIDTSEIPGDPKASLDKMEVVRQAALAPAEPSAVDRQVAAEASVKISELKAELHKQNSEAVQSDRSEPDPKQRNATLEEDSAADPDSIDDGIRARGAVIASFYAKASHAQEPPSLALQA